MTTEEIVSRLDEQFNNCFGEEECRFHDCDGCKKAYVEAIKALEAVKWISPEERLPEIYENVLIKYRVDDGYEKKTAVTIAYRFTGDQWKEINLILGYVYTNEIIGWMELPSTED